MHILQQVPLHVYWIGKKVITYKAILPLNKENTSLQD